MTDEISEGITFVSFVLAGLLVFAGVMMAVFVIKAYQSNPDEVIPLLAWVVTFIGAGLVIGALID